MYSKKDTVTLMLSEFFDRFNFYGIQSILVLYLIHIIVLSKHSSLTIYGAYSSLGFILPVVGGYIVDKFQLKRHRFVVLGIIFIIGGDLILLFYPQQLLLWGLSLIIVGISFFKSNNVALFGTLYKHIPNKRDAAFAYYYAAMNAGAITGPLVYGSLSLVIGWQYGFSTSILGFSFSLLLYILRAKFLAEGSSVQIKQKTSVAYKLCAVFMSLFTGVYLCLNSDKFLFFIIVASLVVVIGFLVVTAKQLKPEERNKLLLLTVAITYSIFFYASSIQVSSSLMLYLNSGVNTRIFGFTIPEAYFMSISSLFIILLTPLAAKIWPQHGDTDSTTLVKRVNLSIYLAALSFVLIAISALLPKAIINWQVLCILVGLILLGVGELAVAPIITSAVTYLAPEGKHGVFMGVVYLSVGYSAYVASLVADVISYHHSFIDHYNMYFQNFLLVAIVTLVIAVSMTVMKKRLVKLCPN